MKRHANPKANKDDMNHVKRVAKEAFPKLKLRFLSHGDLGGHRAPRVCTLAYRLEDSSGKHRSNVVWVMPQGPKGMTANDIRRAVDESNGC